MSKRQSNITNFFGKTTPKQSRNEPPSSPPPPAAAAVVVVDEKDEDMVESSGDSDSDSPELEDEENVEKVSKTPGPSLNLDCGAA